MGPLISIFVRLWNNISREPLFIELTRHRRITVSRSCRATPQLRCRQWRGLNIRRMLCGESYRLKRGFLTCIWSAAFTIVGPELVSMTAAEAKHPRIYIKNTYKSVYWRFFTFFVGSALCVGIVVAYNDPTLVGILNGDLGGAGTASASPYVIAMQNMKISILPHIVSALLCTSIFSAGNNLVFCGIRTLYGLALQGRAPKILTKCTKSGVPVFAFGVTMFFPFLSLLSLSNGSSQVLQWLINIITGGGIIDFVVICVTYISFYRAHKAQGISRDYLPYKGWFQPYSGYIALILKTMIVLVYGYISFSPWNTANFFIYYSMLMIDIILFFFWKVYKKATWLKPRDVDLVWQTDLLSAYESTVEEPVTTFWGEMLDLVRFWKWIPKRNEKDV